MEYVGTVFTTILFLNTVAAMITVFREPREISATWAWLLVLWLFPGFGFLLYFFLGRKLSKQRIYEMREQRALGLNELVSFQENMWAKYQKDYSDESTHLDEMAMMFLKSDSALIAAENDVNVFINGDEKFEALLEDIQQAQHHIHILYFIFKDDEIGKKIMNALIEKAKEGVDVRIVYDAMGSRSSSILFWRKLEKVGGQTVAFFGQSIGFINFRMNYRNHRKIVIIDGQVGYLGGMNIGDEYLGKGKLGYWRDTHLRISGQAVHSLQSRFLMDWNAAVKDGKDLPYQEEFFPVPKTRGETVMQIVSSGPDHDYQQIKMGLLKMIMLAKEYIFIQTPYFVPDEALVEALTMAALSGVDVRIMIPCKPDHPFVYRATEFYANTLREAGAKIYIYQNGFLHAKTMVVDDMTTTIGTANFDIRSFKLNFEINAFMYSQTLALKAKQIFIEDIEDCILGDEMYFKNQSNWIQFKQVLARLFSPIL